MFTGIIEGLGKIVSVEENGSNLSFWIESAISTELKIDQSVSHQGVCLTVDQLKNGQHRVTAIDETLKKTNLSDWKLGDFVNLERCMIMNGRIDGHIVQGHVDGTADCVSRIEKQGSVEYTFEFDPAFARLVIEKGSIAINGTSLTVFNVTRNSFTVAIIPYTYEFTSIQYVQGGSVVNIEFDILGKYILRMQQLQN